MCALAAPTAAQAADQQVLSSYTGANRSYNYNGGLQYHGVKSYDGEADSHSVYAMFSMSCNSTEMRLSNNLGSGKTATAGDYPCTITKHRAGEDVPFAADPLGPWRYPA